MCKLSFAFFDILIKRKCIEAYVAALDGVHSQEVVAMAELELDHLLGGAQIAELLLLRRAALLDQVLEQQGVLAHPLDGLQQVGGQVHLVPKFQLLVLGEVSRMLSLKEGIRVLTGLPTLPYNQRRPL